MSQQSAIEWTDATWNPVTGCSKVSPGCAHCYAEAIELRFGRSEKPWTPENARENVRFWPERLEVPLQWKRPRMIFVNSMSDLFHELVPFEYVDQVFGVMEQASQHTFQVLTKRPERMLEYVRRTYRTATDANPLKSCDPVLYQDHPNIWLGTSIENRHFVGRADVLRQVPSAVRFISAEPLLGPLVPKIEGSEDEPIAWWPDGRDTPCVPYDGLDLHDIEWLIVGGESGPEHRPADAEWVRDLRDAAEHTDTAFFFKQWGGRTPKAGGRELDGRTWDEMPDAAALERVA